MRLKGPPGEKKFTASLIQLCGPEERSNMQEQREGTCSSRNADDDHHEKLKQTVNSQIQGRFKERIYICFYLGLLLGGQEDR